MKMVREIDGRTYTFELTDEELRQAAEQYEFDCRAQDILGAIKEKFAEAFETLAWFGSDGEIVAKMTWKDGDQSQKAAECLVWSAENALGHNDSYWESFWDSVQYVVDEELRGIGCEEEQITVLCRNGHIYVMKNGCTAADITPEGVEILDFELFADSENRNVIAKKLADLNIEKRSA